MRPVRVRAGLSGLLSLLRAVFTHFGGGAVDFEVVGKDHLVIDFGFGEQNSEFVQLIFPVFGSLRTRGLILLAFFGGFAGFGGFSLLLRFEANFRTAAFGSEL